MASKKQYKQVMLEVQDLAKTYDNQVRAVDGIDLNLYQGEILGLLGPNGAGKTTTISMILGLIKKSNGKITILGKEVKNGTENEIIANIGYAPQELVFYPFLTVKENADVFAHCYQIPNKKQRVQDLLNLLQLTEIVDRRAEFLSGGQKRRLNLLLAMLHKPSILLLDEPAAGMDPQSRHVLWNSIKKLANEEKLAIILTTHLMEVADRLSDRICIIDNGKIVAEGTSDELKAQYGEGQVLVFEWDKSSPKKKVTKFKTKLIQKYPDVSFDKRTFQIRTKDWSKDIQKIVGLAKQNDIMKYITNFFLRNNTLEDVFIALTGKKLRE